MSRSLQCVVSGLGLALALGAAPVFASTIQRTKSFSLPLGAPCGSYPSGRLAAADFDGDGRFDIAFVQGVADDASHCHAQWGVLLNQGSGKFRLAAGPTVVGGPTFSGGYIASGDFNRDGRMDIVVGAASEGTFHVFFGNGNGTFAEHPVTLPFRLSSVADIDVADTNGDGILDIGLVDGGQNHGALVYVGDGTGNFNSTEPAPAGGVPSSMRFVDVDNNGTFDVVMITPGRGYDVAINDGHGNFSLRPGFQDSTAYDIARVGEMSGDAYVDLVMNATGGSINVEKNNQGAFPYFLPPTVLSTGGSAVTALRLPDFDGDGKRDILAGIIGGPGGADVALLSNTGGGNFSAPVYFTTGLAGAGIYNATICDLLVRDIDADGKTDIVAMGPSELAVFVAPGDPIFRNGFDVPLLSD